MNIIKVVGKLLIRKIIPITITLLAIASVLYYSGFIMGYFAIEDQHCYPYRYSRHYNDIVELINQHLPSSQRFPIYSRGYISGMAYRLYHCV